MKYDMLMDEATGPVMQERQEREVRKGKCVAELLIEYESATRLHGPLHSAHEAYAVILEELDEFWEEVRKKQQYRDPVAMRTERLHVAAMCVRAAVDVRLEPGARRGGERYADWHRLEPPAIPGEHHEYRAV